MVTSDCNRAEKFPPASPISDAAKSQHSVFDWDSGGADPSKPPALPVLCKCSLTVMDST